jgi:hypothetical protein
MTLIIIVIALCAVRYLLGGVFIDCYVNLYHVQNEHGTCITCVERCLSVERGVEFGIRPLAATELFVIYYAVTDTDGLRKIIKSEKNINPVLYAFYYLCTRLSLDLRKSVVVNEV